MKAAFTDGNRQIEIRNVSDPTPGEGEVLLKIEASGMCGSDLHAYRAPAGPSSAGMVTSAMVMMPPVPMPSTWKFRP